MRHPLYRDRVAVGLDGADERDENERQEQAEEACVEREVEAGPPTLRQPEPRRFQQWRPVHHPGWRGDDGSHHDADRRCPQPGRAARVEGHEDDRCERRERHQRPARRRRVHLLGNASQQTRHDGKEVDRDQHDHRTADRGRDQPAEQRQPRGKEELHHRRRDHERRQQRQSTGNHRGNRHADERAGRAHVQRIASAYRTGRPGLQDGGEAADHQRREHRPLQALGVVRRVERDDRHEDDAAQDDAHHLQAQPEGQRFRGRLVHGVAQASARGRAVRFIHRVVCSRRRRRSVVGGTVGGPCPPAGKAAAVPRQPHPALRVRADHNVRRHICMPSGNRGGARGLKTGRNHSRGSAKTCSTEPDPGGRCMVSGNAMRAFLHEMLQPGPDGIATYWRPSTA